MTGNGTGPTAVPCKSGFAVNQKTHAHILVQPGPLNLFMFAGLCFVVRAGLNMGQDRQLPGGSTHDRHIF